MSSIKERLSQKMTLKISRGRFCLLAWLVTFLFAAAMHSMRQLLSYGHRHDVLATSIGSFIAGLAALVVFFFAGDEILPKATTND